MKASNALQLTMLLKKLIHNPLVLSHIFFYFKLLNFNRYHQRQSYYLMSPSHSKPLT